MKKLSLLFLSLGMAWWFGATNAAEQKNPVSDDAATAHRHERRDPCDEKKPDSKKSTSGKTSAKKTHGPGKSR